jgi:hypothetical protein
VLFALLVVKMAFAAPPNPSPPQAQRSPYIVLPIHSERPPPTDPTLLRTTKIIAEAIYAVVDAGVRVASRGVRDEHCPSEDGQCPEHIADLLGAERVISMALTSDYKALRIRVYRGARGVERQGSIPCRWEEGAVECDTGRLAAVLKGQGPPPPLDHVAVQKAFERLGPSFVRCKKDNAASKTPEGDPPSVSFRVRADGRVSDVRISPDELSDDAAYACIARMVESLRLPPFEGSAEMFHFSLAERSAKDPRPARKKKHVPSSSAK